jgi:hypothetical protein
MNFVEEPLVFSKTDRLHRAIISFLPAQEREENYLPFGERSTFSMRKEYDLVIKELKKEMFIEYEECPAGKSWEDIRDLYILKLQNERERRIMGDGRFVAFNRIEHLSSRGVFSYAGKIGERCRCGCRHLIPLLTQCYNPDGVFTTYYFVISIHKDWKNFRDYTIDFLRQNGFTITGRERNKTYVKMLMSF